MKIVSVQAQVLQVVDRLLPVHDLPDHLRYDLPLQGHQVFLLHDHQDLDLPDLLHDHHLQYHQDLHLIVRLAVPLRKALIDPHL